MGLYLYDEALLNKFRAWTEKTKLKVYGPADLSRLIEVTADEKGDKPIQLPLISIAHIGGYSLKDPYKKPLTYDGKLIDANEKTSISLNAIPISIEYQIDVYTRYFKEADQYMRNLVFNIINYPKLSITIPYNDTGIPHISNIRINGDVEDNSDNTSLMLKAGQFTRLTLDLNIDDAYLWDARVRNIVSLDADVLFNDEGIDAQ